MRTNAVFLVQTAEGQSAIRACCPEAEVMTAGVDLDALDLGRCDLVIAGGADFVAGLAQRLRVRYAGQNGARFIYVAPPRQASRLAEIRQFLDDAGLRGKYSLWVPRSGFLRAVAQIARYPGAAQMGLKRAAHELPSLTAVAAG